MALVEGGELKGQRENYVENTKEKKDRQVRMGALIWEKYFWNLTYFMALKFLMDS